MLGCLLYCIATQSLTENLDGRTDGRRLRRLRDDALGADDQESRVVKEPAVLEEHAEIFLLGP